MKIINNLKLRLNRKLFFKNLILSAGLVLLSLVLIGFAFSLISYNYVVHEQRKTLDSTAGVIATTARAVGAEAELSVWELKITITSVSLATGSHISICSLSGNVLATSDLELYSSSLDYLLPEELLSTLHNEGAWSGFSDLGGYYESKRWVSAVAVKDKYTEEPLGYVFAAAQRGDIGEIWRSYALIFLIAALIVTAAVIPVSVLLSRKQSRPLSEMAEAAMSFARGSFKVRVKETGRQDEIGELASAFNRMAESLEKSEQDRREFISNISHELKTPMTTIGGYAEGLLDGTIPMESAEKYLTIIADETRRLSRLVRKMLDISRMKEAVSSNASFDICETLTRTLLSLEAKINGRKLGVDLRLPETQLLAVKGDMDEVSQVIYNILDNAVKFAAEGTTLRVCVWTQDKKAYVSVTDRGEDIPETDLPHIFERFHKSDKSRGLDRDGVGLGLYIVKTIIDDMGEDVWVRSRGGETEFVFSLSLA